MISAIVLAAGSSIRMQGTNKLLLPYKGKTIIASVVQNIQNAGIEDIIVVTGFEDDKINNALQNFPVRLVYNHAHKKGMTGTVQNGVAAAKGKGYMICLGDMVATTSGEYALIKNSFDVAIEKDNMCICVPAFKNQKGNPVVFSSFYREAILKHREMDGCRQIMQSNKEHIYQVKMPMDHVLKDIDFYEDYKEDPHV
jgi:molybdenum cofactor cytidylyltransferase